MGRKCDGGFGEKENIGITIGSLYEVDSKIMSLSESQLKSLKKISLYYLKN